METTRAILLYTHFTLVEKFQVALLVQEELARLLGNIPRAIKFLLIEALYDI